MASTLCLSYVASVVLQLLLPLSVALSTPLNTPVASLPQQYGPATAAAATRHHQHVMCPTSCAGFLHSSLTPHSPCRAKAGGKQSTKDATGKFARSAGSRLRRYNEAALSRDITQLIKDWSSWLAAAGLVFVAAPGSNSRCGWVVKGEGGALSLQLLSSTQHPQSCVSAWALCLFKPPVAAAGEVTACCASVLPPCLLLPAAASHCAQGVV